MASIGPQNPTAAADGGLGVAWNNPTNVFASDNARATAAIRNVATGTKALVVNGFDFSSIPSGATITGIVVEIERSCSSTSGSPHDGVVRMTKDGSTLIGTDKASATTWPTTDAYGTYGTSSDLWGTTWTDTEIKASTFGISIQATGSGGKWSTTVQIDHVRITVYYTAGAPVLAVTGTADNGTYDLGTVSVSATNSHQFTLTNTGTASDTLGTLTISGTGWSISGGDNPSGNALAASGTTTVTVVGTFGSAGVKTGILTIPSNDAASPYVVNLTAAAVVPTAAITGTAIAAITEADIVAGGKTIIITLTNDTWVAAGATFDAQRQPLIDAFVSAQAESTGWNATVRALQSVTGVVRTSDTVVTITWDAQATYDITATETITDTIPSAALTGAGGDVVATPTFAITAVANGGKYRGLMGVG